MTRPKPCPFCGETSVEVIHIEYKDYEGYPCKGWKVHCLKCKCSLSPFKSGYEAYNVWQQRNFDPIPSVEEINHFILENSECGSIAFSQKLRIWLTGKAL